MQKKLTVSQLNAYIRGVFDDEFVLHDVTVCGEVFEFKRMGARTFITLKEGECTLPCVSFRAVDDGLLGKNVESVGTVNFYEKTGRVSFLIDEITPSGDGKILLDLAKLRESLRVEGLFDNRLELPSEISKVAVITSEHGAVLHDIASVVRSKGVSLAICVYDVRVQGRESASEISTAIDDLNAGKLGIDAIIIARGGGSATDLAAYNTEEVARAVARSKIPIISAVGHETDYTLCDLCASVRAGTPSIAADIVAYSAYQKTERIRNLSKAICAGIEKKFAVCRNRVISRGMGIIDYSESKISSQSHRIVYDATQIARKAENILSAREDRLKFIAAMLDKVNPLKVLSQGYSKLVMDGREITSSKMLKTGDDIKIIMRDGKVKAKVGEVKHDA